MTEGEVRAVAARKANRLNQSDLEGWLETLADDVVFLPPTGETLRGKEALRAWATPILAAFELDVDERPVEVTVSDSVALVWYEYTTALTPRADGPRIVEEGRAFEVLHRDPERGWQVYRQMWQTDAP